MPTRVGFVGLGLMGAPMAENLLAPDFTLYVWNRTASRAEPLVAKGASAVSDPTELGGVCDIVATCLPTGSEVRELLVDRGLLRSLAPGATVVDHSTISPGDARSLAELCGESGVGYLDAPVSGGPPGAAARTLCIMVGGPADTLERARPVLEASARKVVHVGPAGSGQIAKLANNLSVAVTYLGLQESFELARRNDIDPGVLLEVLTAATASSHTLETRAPVEGLQPRAPASNGWAAGFATDMMAKDLDLALRAASAVTLDMPGTELARSRLKQAQDAGMGSLDFSVFAKLLR